MSELGKLPPLPWQGGCQCGQVRYTINDWPLTLYVCHCTECQKQSASAFGMSLRVRKRTVAITGKLKDWRRVTDSGHTLLGRFCPECGTRIFHERASYVSDPAGATMNIKAGTLDHAHLLKPVGHIWLMSKQAGTVIPQNVITYDGQPEDYNAMIAAWIENAIPANS